MPRGLPWGFNYVIEKNPEDHPLGRTVLRPLVETRVVGEHATSNRYAALLDSGSDYTLAGPIVAMEAGINIRAGRETTVRVGGAERPISVIEARIRLCDPLLGEADGGCATRNSLEWGAEIGFFTKWDDPPFSVILGQVGFFDQFTVVMSRLSQVVILEHRDYLDEQYGIVVGAPLPDPPRRF